ncbi:MAG: sensor domain-containing diguanylate cyclase [Arcobacteraceae bacterium]|nr:sensor domain-containing diguanylate cyclase [Arcobacteraceae bacterium]
MLKDSDLIPIEDMTKFESNDLEILLHKILNYLKHITSSDAGTIYLKEEDSLKFYIFQNDSFSYETIYKMQEPLKDFKFKIEPNTNTIAVESFITKQVIMIDDIYDETVFDFKSAKEFDKKFNYKTKSILTAPLVNFYSGEVIGILQLINKKNDDGKLLEFSPEDKEFISLSSYLSALSILTTQKSLKEKESITQSVETRIIERTKILEDMQKHLLEQVHKDSMTGLFNRRYFNEMADILLFNSKKEKAELSIIILDIDNFKTINDTYGHSIGDDVIYNIAQLLKQSTRSSDVCVRFGGEEFVIVLPHTSLENGIKIAEKIRNIIETNVLILKTNEKIQYTISMGISKIEQEDTSLEIALKKADLLLYKAKDAGKNQIKF